MLKPLLRTTAAAVLAAGLVVALAAAQAEKKGDKEVLQGAWVITSMEMAGKKAPADEIKEQRLFFTGDTILLGRPGASQQGTYKLDATKKPKTLDIAAQQNMEAIYELAGDELKLCLGQAGRPTEFKATETTVLITLKRDTSDAAKEMLKKAAARAAFDSSAAGMSARNLKQIALALHNYHDTFGKLPTAAAFGKDGKALLSWRVLILPFLEADDLYKRFKMDEPWDGPNNKKLLAEMPKVYAPLGDAKAGPGETFYQVFLGKGTVFEGTRATALRDILDGTSNTAMVAEAGQAVPWTKPADLDYDDAKPLPKLGGMYKGDFNVLMCDGAVHVIRRDFDEKTMRLIITRADGTPIDFSKLDPK